MPSRPKATLRKPKGVGRLSTPRPASRQEQVRACAQAAALLVLAGVYSPISQLSLSPVYGSIPASLYHQTAITMTALVATIGSSYFKRFLPANSKNWIPVLAYWIPTVQFVLFQHSGKLGPVYGPVVTEAFTFLPLLLLSVFSAGQLLQSFDFTSLGSNMREMALAVGSYMTISFVGKTAGALLPQYMGTHGFFTRSGLQFLSASAFAALSPSMLLVAAIPAVLLNLFANPHYNTDRALDRANGILQAHKYNIIDRTESLTGYISVLESRENEFRVLRCDHSLLGGQWLLTPARKKQGQKTPETIYAVFTMLEAVRLVETEETKADTEKNALVIGLGVGAAPSALISHGINTTIVEIDPMVHRYATKYFDLPSNHTAAIMDAVSFVSEAFTNRAGSYDYILHDVFTGGAEPASLFTYEFLDGLRALLTENGVVAINYAGDLALPSTKLILNTIHAVFPVCRIFRDSHPRPDATSDFINMVVFCVKSDPTGSGSGAITFRETTEADFLGSISRRQFLKPQPELEVRFTPGDVGGKDVLRRGQTQLLDKYQARGALEHWKIMRQNVLPDVVWETW